MKKRTVGSQVIGGFKITAWVLAAFTVWALLGAGIVSITRGGRFPVFVGYVLIVVATVVMLSTIHVWARHVAGFLAPGIINGFMMLGTGHALNTLTPVARSTTLVLLGLLVLAILATRRFQSERLNAVDRLALCAFVFLATWASLDANELRALILAVLGTAGLVGAWVISRRVQYRSSSTLTRSVR